MPGLRILLMDKDGSIVEPIEGKFSNTPENQKPKDGAYEFLERFAAMGYLIAVVSNQGGVGCGYKTLDDAIAEMKVMLEFFPMIDIACFCPDCPLPWWMRWSSIFTKSRCHVVSRHSDYVFDSAPLDEDFISAGGKSRAAKFRKPGSLMLWLAVRQLCTRNMASMADIESLVMMGDRPEDYQASAGYPSTCSYGDARAIPILNQSVLRGLHIENKGHSLHSTD